MKLKQKIAFGVVALLLVFLISAVITGGVIERQKQEIDNIGDQNEKIISFYQKLDHDVQVMQYNIVQVQQFFTDLGATRAMIDQKSADDDYVGAEENAASFKKLSSEVRALAAKEGETELVKLVDEATEGFPAYYDSGKKMAQVYIASGAEAGNKLMPQFDAASDRLQDPMTKMAARVSELYSDANKKNIESITTVRTGIKHLIGLASGAVGIVLLFLLAAAALLIKNVINPIKIFTQMLSEIAQGNLKVDIVGLHRKDEIGQMAVAMDHMRHDLKETFKLKEMLDMMPCNIMFADPQEDFKITYCNRQSLTTLQTLEAYLPRKASQVIGQSFDVFHKNPEHQRKMLEDPKNLPHRAQFKVGPETIALTVSAIYGQDASYIGPMAVWEIVSKKVQMAETFEQSVKSVVDVVKSTAGSVNVSAQTMASSAEQTAQQAGVCATAAEEASSNVHTVAAASEELSASISEITQQVNEATRIAQAAANEAGQTNAHVKSLAEATQKIGDVVNLISQIAGQTNLLALNATIEAARAGEAGKGFAVVASEVKGLATQTAKATEEISQQINHLQNVTQTAVGGITHITETIERINQIQSSISAAVEQQNAATIEISRNVQEASAGTSQVSTTITSVRQLSQETGTAASSLQGVSAELQKKAIVLDDEVNKFLQSLRTT